MESFAGIRERLFVSDPTPPWRSPKQSVRVPSPKRAPEQEWQGSEDLIHPRTLVREMCSVKQRLREPVGKAEISGLVRIPPAAAHRLLLNVVLPRR